MTTIVNLTPHPITIGSLTIAPTLPPARAGEWVEAADQSGEVDDSYLYAPSEVSAAEERGEEHEPEAIEPTTVHCECGATTGVRCLWVGPVEDTVIVEWMPEYLRASHEAAGNSGTYPHNGATRIRCEASCADRIVEADGEWARIVE